MKKRETKMENQIQHFIHHHPLRLEQDVIDKPCLVCREVITSPPRYSCFNDFCLRKVHMHKSCAELPPEIVHPFHTPHSLTLLILPSNVSENFTCNACWRSAWTPSRYHCSFCDFNLDLHCASLMATKISQVQEQHQIQQHLGHPHPLILCHNNNNNTNFNFPCSFCKLPINGSRIYVCLDCKCLLDESCAQWPSQIQHPFHPQHPLTLLDQRYNTTSRLCRVCGKVVEKGILFKCLGCSYGPDQDWDFSNKSRCSACGKLLEEGFAFNCSYCNFSLDPCCASLIPPTQNSEQLSHPHPLILCEKKKSYGISCDACQLNLEDDSVVYVCLECKLLLHKSCADLPLEVKHSFYHHQHTLTLLEYSRRQLEEEEKRNRMMRRQMNSRMRRGEEDEEDDEFKDKYQCHACYVYASGFAYECSNCAIFFDIGCTFSKPRTFIKSELHRQHPLAFFTVKPNNLNCHACNKTIQTPFFRCVDCNFSLHLRCVPKLPSTVKDKHHRHPLTLTDYPIKDFPDEDENAEFYCDSCEERRELHESTYYCEECHFVSHIDCQLSEILSKLNEEWSLSCQLGDTKLDMSASGCEDNTRTAVSKVLMKEKIVEEEGVEPESPAVANKVDMESSSSRKVFSSVYTDTEIMAREVSSVVASKTEGTRVVELCEEIVMLRSKVECIATELKTTEEKLKELEERRAEYAASLLRNFGDSETVY